MQFRAVVLASAAFALTQAIEFTNPSFSTITAGDPFTLTWTDADGPVTITLKNGDPNNLQTVTVIGSGLSGGTFTWNVPATLAADTYALEIRDGPTENDTNYSTQFELIGGVTSASSIISRTTTGTASSSTGSSSSESVTTESETSTSSSASVSSQTGSSTSASASSSRTLTRSTTSASATSSPTTAPAGGMASGLTSNLALVFLAAGALFMIN